MVHGSSSSSSHHLDVSVQQRCLGVVSKTKVRTFFDKNRERARLLIVHVTHRACVVVYIHMYSIEAGNEVNATDAVDSDNVEVEDLGAATAYLFTLTEVKSVGGGRYPGS